MKIYRICLLIGICVLAPAISLWADEVGDHVFNVVITRGVDYGSPVLEDTEYDFQFEIRTDETVQFVQVVTPVGYVFSITKTPVVSENVETEYYPDSDGGFVWEYEGLSYAPAGLASYADGWYDVTVYYANQLPHHLLVWYGVPDTDQAISQPVQEPVITFPEHQSKYASPITIQWLGVTDLQVNYIHINLQNRTDESEESLLLDVGHTQWGPHDLMAGAYEVEVSFAALYFVEDDGNGIEIMTAKYTECDYEFSIGGYAVSGRVIDKISRIPLSNMRVGCWHETLREWTEVRTDPDGFYQFDDIAAGEVQIRAVPDCCYAMIGQMFELEDDVANLNFELPAEAILSGYVVDSETAEPVSNMRIIYWNEGQAVFQDDRTDAEGRFTLPLLPPGLADVRVEPDIETGYAWSAEDSTCVNLGESERLNNRFIAIKKGALVQGRVVDSLGQPVSGGELDCLGRNGGGWPELNPDGSYAIRLAEGVYNLGVYLFEGETRAAVASPIMFTVTDSDEVVTMPNHVVYDEQSGGTISGGAVLNQTLGQGTVLITALPGGTRFSPDDLDSWYTTLSVADVVLEPNGDFELSGLPPGDYDVHLIVRYETPDDVESITVLDSALQTPVGTDDVSLSFDGPTGSAEGYVENASGRPMLKAAVLLFTHSEPKEFIGFTDTDADGRYFIGDVLVGTYQAISCHSKCQSSTWTVSVTQDAVTQVPVQWLGFLGAKYGPDLNGNGRVDLEDVRICAEQWLTAGDAADFDKSGRVDLFDWIHLPRYWLGQAFWF